MKKYNTPEIEALALETIDVIATSGDEAAKEALGEYGAFAHDAGDITDVADFAGNWSW